MPRTKVAKSTAKRVREGEDPMDLKLKNLDSRISFIYQDIEYMFNEHYSKLDEQLQTFKGSIPPEVLDMKVGDLKRLDLSTFVEVKNHLQSLKNLNATASALDMSIRDEGYLTEASTTSSHAGSRRTTKKSGLMGPLDSARARSRRSRSAGALQTPSVLNSIRAKKPVPKPNTTVTASAIPPSRNGPAAHSLDDSMTSEVSTATGRMSRSQYRTPGGRKKAASADRVGTITPKVQLNNPISILRYARMGETLVSASGSPVAGGLPSLTDTANIAIPLADGMLSVRPGSMGEFDRNLLHRIDPATLNQLKKLQDNLNMVISNINKAHGGSV